MTKKPQPAMSEPALLAAPVLFNDLGTYVMRVSNSRHHYAKTPVWNADESLAITNDGQVLNGKTFAYIRTITLPSEHKTWSNIDPRYIYGANRDQKQWARVDATTGQLQVLKTYSAAELGLSTLTKVSYGDYESNLDNADTGATLIANGNVPFIIDPKTGAIRCVIKGGFSNAGRVAADATMSQDGRYALVYWNYPDGLNTDGTVKYAKYGIDAYNAADCSYHKKISSYGGHYDACVSTAGEQVVVHEAWPNGVAMLRISDAAETIIFDADRSPRGHVSCRNTKRPGWVYHSVINDTCDTYQLNMVTLNRIWSIKLDGSKQVEIYAWDHQPCPGSYSYNPMAVPSRYGNRVWWKTMWDGNPMHSFVAGKVLP